MLATWCSGYSGRERHQPLARLNTEGIFEVPTSAAPPPRKIKKPKRRSTVDRYLDVDGWGREKISKINYRRAGDVSNFVRASFFFSLMGRGMRQEGWALGRRHGVGIALVLWVTHGH